MNFFRRNMNAFRRNFQAMREHTTEREWALVEKIHPSIDSTIFIILLIIHYYSFKKNFSLFIICSFITFSFYLFFSYECLYVRVNSKGAHPPPGQYPGHLTFLKKIGQIPHHLAIFDSQMPHY